MSCEHLLRELGDFVDGAAAAEICREFEQHLEGCEACRVVVDTLKRTITLYKGDQAVDLPLAVHERLKHVLRGRWRRAVGRSATLPPAEASGPAD